MSATSIGSFVWSVQSESGALACRGSVGVEQAEIVWNTSEGVWCAASRGSLSVASRDSKINRADDIWGTSSRRVWGITLLTAKQVIFIQSHAWWMYSYDGNKCVLEFKVCMMHVAEICFFTSGFFSLSVYYGSTKTLHKI